MKKFLFVLAALIMTPTSAQAMDASMCPTLGEIAGKIMTARQSGIPKEQVLEVIIPGPSQKIILSLVEVAYSTPMYPIQRMRDTAVENFQMQTEYLCYKSFSV